MASFPPHLDQAMEMANNVMIRREVICRVRERAQAPEGRAGQGEAAAACYCVGDVVMNMVDGCPAVVVGELSCRLGVL